MAKQMNAQSQFDRVTEITKQLEEGIQTLFESEKFKTWLSERLRYLDACTASRRKCGSEWTVPEERRCYRQ